MRHLAYVFASLAIVVGCVSCSEAPVDGFEELIEEEDPQTPEVNKLQLSTKSSELVKIANTFSYDFIDRINSGVEGSYVVSPLSMQFLLGMILNGAKGDTADEICKVLGYGAGEIDDVNEFCLSMLQQFPGLDKDTKLAIANAVVVNQRFRLKDSYKTAVGKFYEAEVSNMDFTDNAGTTQKINKWCSDHTEGLIPKVLDEVDPDMFSYLMNALYFKSAWQTPFKAENTASGKFTKSDGKTVSIPMMKMNEELYHYQNDVFQCVCLPYGNGTYKMNLLLPMEGKTLSDVTAALKNVGVKDLPYIRAKVDLMLPKFETKFEINLNGILKAMGMPTAFTDKADFKGMSDDLSLCLSFVKQFARIIVNEEGSEAAAISIGGVMLTSAPRPVTFHADKPFLYLISETTTGAVLFAGRYSGE